MTQSHGSSLPPRRSSATKDLEIAGLPPKRLHLRISVSFADCGGGCVEPHTFVQERFTTVYIAAIEAIDIDLLTGKGPPGTDQEHSVSPHRLDTFVNMLDNAAANGFDVGDYETACAMLNALQVRSDGVAQPQDFVTGPAAPELNASIRMVIAELDGCELREVNP